MQVVWTSWCSTIVAQQGLEQVGEGKKGVLGQMRLKQSQFSAALSRTHSPGISDYQFNRDKR